LHRRDSYRSGRIPAPFLERDESDAAFFPPGAARGHFLLTRGLSGTAHRQGRRCVEATRHDTLAGRAGFFSYRRKHAQRHARLWTGPVGIALED